MRCPNGTMPEIIKAALSTDLAISNQSSAIIECPADIQYMPHGVHQINASRGGQPVSLSVTVDASTAANLDHFLKDRLATAANGQDGRPSFIPDDEGKVISSDTNMGGLVNRAAFKSIQPLFAKGETPSGLKSQPSALSDRLRAVQGARATDLPRVVLPVT